MGGRGVGLAPMGLDAGRLASMGLDATKAPGCRRVPLFLPPTPPLVPVKIEARLTG